MLSYTYSPRYTFLEGEEATPAVTGRPVRWPAPPYGRGQPQDAPAGAKVEAPAGASSGAGGAGGGGSCVAGGAGANSGWPPAPVEKHAGRGSWSPWL